MTRSRILRVVEDADSVLIALEPPRASSPRGSAVRMRRYRQRQKAAGRIEVRGIYAPRELHPAIREAARRIVSGVADQAE